MKNLNTLSLILILSIIISLKPDFARSDLGTGTKVTELNTDCSGNEKVLKSTT